MSQPYIGQIDMFGGTFAPRGFAYCNGQLLSIQQNTALFSLIGVTYGGDGSTTFALPNLQSRLPVHMGTGPGLSNYPIGRADGTPSVTLTMGNLPQHNHILTATNKLATTTTIEANSLPGQPSDGTPPTFYGVQTDGQPVLPHQTLSPFACALAGGGQSHSNLMPSLCITFIIALTGVFPSRN